MRRSKSVDEVAAAIAEMTEQEREQLLLRMAKMDDLLEDLEDVADLLRFARESGRPYEDFLAELKAEGRDV